MKYIKFESKKYGTDFVMCILSMREDYNKYINYLNKLEIKELSLITNEKCRKEFVLGKAVSKRAVMILTDNNKPKDLNIKHGVFRQPVLEGCVSNIQISISHCSEYVTAVAFEEYFPCGVDVEIIRFSNNELIEYNLTAKEKALLNKGITEEYTVFWTAKEAISKVLKIGLTSELSLYEIEEYNYEEPYYRGKFKNFNQYEFVAASVGNCILTLAMPKHSDIVLREKGKIGSREMNFKSEVTIEVLRMQVREMINYTYVLIDEEEREAFIIDPSWELDKITNVITKYDLNVKGILLTHYHYDHVNLVDKLVELYGCKAFISLDEINYYNFKCSYMEPLFDTGEISLGNHEILCIETPGHSKGSMCFMIDNKIFTGDTLFMEGCGLCDMKGGSADDMFESLVKLKKLVNNDTEIYPGHAFLLPIGKRYEEVYDSNLYLQLTNKEKFVEFRMRKNRNQPKFI